MELIARIDCDGVTFIGKWGRDIKWVIEGNAKPVTIVRNKHGGQNVSVRDIETVRAEHRKGRNDFVAFADDDVKEFWDKAQQAFILSL